MKTFQEATKILARGTKVRVPHQGKLVTGKIVRFDKGDKHGSPFYVVDIGKLRSEKIPVQKIREDLKTLQELQNELKEALKKLDPRKLKKGDVVRVVYRGVPKGGPGKLITVPDAKILSANTSGNLSVEFIDPKEPRKIVRRSVQAIKVFVKEGKSFEESRAQDDAKRERETLKSIEKGSFKGDASARLKAIRQTGRSTAIRNQAAKLLNQQR